MFGYIKPFRPELRIREAEEYRAVYCGLCRELGKSFGLFAKMTLSYDFAFMAMLMMSLEEKESPEYESCRCIAHPFRKHCSCCGNKSISLSARAAMILIYYKLRDDLYDKGILKKIRAALLMPMASAARKKALSKGGAEAEIIDSAAAEMMAEQKKLEAEKCSVSDMAAEPTAKFLEKTLALCSGEKNERPLRRFGYLLGRYIYLCDALDDLEDDIKKKNYNPFIFGGEEAAANAKSALFLTTAELGDDLVLLAPGKYREILENIVCLGLRAEVERIINKKGEDGNGKSI